MSSNNNNNNNNNNNSGEAITWDPTEVPKDATIISLILQSMGLDDDEFEPRVVNQLMEFMYRYVAEVLQDGQMYMEHAGKQAMDLTDIRLAIQSRVNYSFTQPPPRELLLSLAQSKNTVVLPQLPSKFGVHLPPDEHCLINTNYQVDPKQDKATEEAATSKSTTENVLMKDITPPPPTKKPDRLIPIHINTTPNNAHT